MTRRTVDQRLYVEFLHQLEAKNRLISRRLPLVIEYLIQWPNLFFGRTMAIEAPFHQQRAVLANKLHLVNPSVTTRTADALADMHSMIEIHMVGQLMHAVPSDRRVFPITFTYRCKQFRADPNLFVAIHARLGRGHPGIRRSFDRVVAISAINAER